MLHCPQRLTLVKKLHLNNSCWKSKVENYVLVRKKNKKKNDFPAIHQGQFDPSYPEIPLQDNTTIFFLICRLFSHSCCFLV